MSVLSFNKKIVDNISIYFNFGKRHLEYRVYVKKKIKYTRYYKLSIYLPIKKWSRKGKNQRSYYRDMYISLFKYIAVDYLNKNMGNFDILERDKIPNDNNIKSIIIKKSELKRYRSTLDFMIEGKEYDIKHGIWIF